MTDRSIPWALDGPRDRRLRSGKVLAPSPAEAVRRVLTSLAADPPAELRPSDCYALRAGSGEEQALVSVYGDELAPAAHAARWGSEEAAGDSPGLQAACEALGLPVPGRVVERQLELPFDGSPLAGPSVIREEDQSPLDRKLTRLTEEVVARLEIRHGWSEVRVAVSRAGSFAGWRFTAIDRSSREAYYGVSDCLLASVPDVVGLAWSMADELDRCLRVKGAVSGSSRP